MAKIACKNGEKEGNYKASSIYNAQTEKNSSTTLKRDQKYAHLQEVTSPNSVGRQAKHSMQNNEPTKAIT